MLILLAARIVLMVYMPMTGTPVDQLRQLPERWLLFQTNFAVAMAMAPVMLYFFISLHQLLVSPISFKKTAGYTLGFFYLLMASVSYGTQLTLVPVYLQQDSFLMAEIWYFFNPDSLAYFINQSGHALWALSALLLFGSLMKETGSVRWLGILFVFSAMASLVAFGGLLASVQGTAMFALVRGGLLIPTALIGFFIGIKNLKSSQKKQDEDSNEQENAKQAEKGEDSHCDEEEKGLATAGDEAKSSSKNRLLMVLLVAIMVVAGVLGGFLGVVSF